ncbi:MAG: Si-specific NAD(P)(+) transhydrogenase [Pseudomonadota bacterium]
MNTDLEQRDVDVVVIGSGPGGEGAAMQSSKLGRSVVVVERFAQVGGGCTHWGTIPSKALRHAIQELTTFQRNPLFREAARASMREVPALLRSAANVIQQQVDMRQSFYERNHVDVLGGQARFVDPHRVEVERPDGQRLLLRAQQVVIATGSRPYRPPDVDFSHPCVFDADTILKLDHTPQNLLVYGAGVIGCEYASMFRNLGIKVNLINTRSHLLSFLDDEIVDALAYHLREQGVLVRHDEECARIEAVADDAVVMHLKSGKQIKVDALLWANGRTGNSNDLGLGAIGLTTDQRGNLSVDEHYRTAVPHIYAVGDVIGPPALASAAYDQGRFAARHMVNPECDHTLVELVPTGIYTSPEISSVGRTERELTEAKVPYELGHSLFKSLARAQITGQTVGVLKLLFHRKTLEILGVHCFGHQAAEIVHIGQAIMAQAGRANSLEYFVNATFNYPTMAEAYRVAALNGLNRLF